MKFKLNDGCPDAWRHVRVRSTGTTRRCDEEAWLCTSMGLGDLERRAANGARRLAARQVRDAVLAEQVACVASQPMLPTTDGKSSTDPSFASSGGSGSAAVKSVGSGVGTGFESAYPVDFTSASANAFWCTLSVPRARSCSMWSPRKSQPPSVTLNLPRMRSTTRSCRDWSPIISMSSTYSTMMTRSVPATSRKQHRSSARRRNPSSSSRNSESSSNHSFPASVLVALARRHLVHAADVPVEFYSGL